MLFKKFNQSAAGGHEGEEEDKVRTPRKKTPKMAVIANLKNSFGLRHQKMHQSQLAVPANDEYSMDDAMDINSDSRLPGKQSHSAGFGEKRHDSGEIVARLSSNITSNQISQSLPQKSCSRISSRESVIRPSQAGRVACRRQESFEIDEPQTIFRSGKAAPKPSANDLTRLPTGHWEARLPHFPDTEHSHECSAAQWYREARCSACSHRDCGYDLSVAASLAHVQKQQKLIQRRYELMLKLHALENQMAVEDARLRKGVSFGEMISSEINLTKFCKFIKTYIMEGCSQS